MAECNAAVRGGGECKLAAGHTGHHSTRAFVCDGCGETRRGIPALVENEADGYPMQFCFLCVKQGERDRMPELGIW